MRTLNLNNELPVEYLNYLFTKMLGNTPISYDKEIRPDSKSEWNIPGYMSRESQFNIMMDSSKISFNRIDNIWVASILVKGSDGKAKYIDCNLYGEHLSKKALHLMAIAKFGYSVEAHN